MSSMANQENKQSAGKPGKIDLTTGPQLASGTGPTSPQLEKDAARAMGATSSWKPSLGGRAPSFHREDQKRALQMEGLGQGGGSI
ncbi:hypothetical protein F4780DRAFT_783284 [Xylariomycetidae sp. FL0641]|nr:hypothetical protein F4780DRAFT_783284 [Xylariomycetidae sp. FL0641]